MRDHNSKIFNQGHYLSDHKKVLSKHGDADLSIFWYNKNSPLGQLSELVLSINNVTQQNIIGSVPNV